jgi:hypothetical protein
METKWLRIAILFKILKQNSSLNKNNFYHMKNKILLLSCILYHFLVFSQTDNRATLSHTYFAPANNSNIENFNQSNVDFGYNLKSRMIAKKVKWDNSFGYKANFFDGGIGQNFQDINYVSSFVYTKNRKNFLIGNLRLNYRSQINRDASLDAIFPTVSAGYMRQSQNNKSIRWAIGVNYNNDFGKNVILPFFMFNYETEKLKFNATLPSSILLLIRNKENFHYGLNATLSSAIFQADNVPKGKIQILNANMFAFAQIKLYKKLWLEAKPGFTIRRDFNFLQSNFEPVPTNGSNRFDPNFVFVSSLIYKMN